MARRLIPAVVAALALALPAAGQAATPLVGTSWVVKRVDGRVPPRDFRGELTFNAHHEWGGRDDCNSIGGRYRSKGSRLRFLDFLSTIVGCDVDPAAPPPNFTGALQRTRSYRMTPRRLVLLGARGHTLARFARRR